VIGIVFIMLIIGLPFFLSHESQEPEFFGLYSKRALIINFVYVCTLVVSFIFLWSQYKRKN